MDRAHCRALTRLSGRFATGALTLPGLTARGLTARGLTVRTLGVSALVTGIVLAGIAPVSAIPGLDDDPSTVDLVVTRRTLDGSLAFDVVEIPTLDAERRSAGLRAQPGVVAVAPSVAYVSLSIGGPVAATGPSGIPQFEAAGVVSAEAGAADPRRAEQWNLDQVGAEGAWSNVDPSGIVVAVIDTGLRADHEDFSGARVLPAVDASAFVDGAGRSPTAPVAGRVGAASDPLGHGTFVSGIVGAGFRNGRGIAPVAPGVQILPITTFSDDGLGSSEAVAPAIVWAVDHGADVVNLSLGSVHSDPTMQAAVVYAESRGVVVVAAAGNFGMAIPVYPAAYPEVLAVAATDRSGRRSSFSETGSWIDLAAPGDDVASTTVDGGYGTWRGTSFAAPHVSAAAALVLAARPHATPAQVRALLVNHSRDAGAPGFDELYGWGILDVGAAVRAASRPSGGYRTVTRAGLVESFGDRLVPGDSVAASSGPPTVSSDAGALAPVGAIVEPARVVGAAAHVGGGFWMVTADGTIRASAGAPHHGDAATAQMRVVAPIVGVAGTPSGGGYWLVASDGGVFSFGDARFFGSLGDRPLNGRMIAVTATPSGAGYWLLGDDGGVFSFGDATYQGSSVERGRAGSGGGAAILLPF